MCHCIVQNSATRIETNMRRLEILADMGQDCMRFVCSADIDYECVLHHLQSHLWRKSRKEPGWSNQQGHYCNDHT